MEMTNLDYIQLHIGYTFKKKGLLCQAFTRKSYTTENKNALNNEVLEFYGDKVLDFIIIKKMSEHYGKIGAGDLFASSKDEGSLTKIKKSLVRREMLASKIRELGFQHRLIMGKGDIEQKIWEQDSVQEDLFEAILGAVAIDSNWNVEILTNVVDRMLNPSFYFENGFNEEFDYKSWIQQWYQRKYGLVPTYVVTKGVRSFELFQEYKCEDIFTMNFQCDLEIAPLGRFKALGESQSKAIIAAAKKAYQYIEKNRLSISSVDEIGSPNFEKAINQLQELYQKKYISEPQYDFSETHDENGNSIWECSCYVESLGRGFVVSDSSKKEAKRKAAYQMVYLYAGEVNNYET